MGLIFALDYDNTTDALFAVSKLRGHVDMFKVGLELFIVGGREFVDEIEVPVFLDLKLHDIPTTVARAAKAALKIKNVQLLSVHASGGNQMLEAAVDAGHDKIAAVTLLTSLDSRSAGAVGFLDTYDYIEGYGHVERPILDMMDAVHDSRVRNIICPARVVGALKNLYPNDVDFVVPGIRLDSAVDDHVAPAQPETAVKNGATHLVVGRPIRDAKDPVAVADEIKERMGVWS